MQTPFGLDYQMAVSVAQLAAAAASTFIAGLSVGLLLARVLR